MLRQAEQSKDLLERELDGLLGIPQVREVHVLEDRLRVFTDTVDAMLASKRYRLGRFRLDICFNGDVAIKNLTLPLILYTPETVVLSTLLWGYWDRANTAETAALGTIMVVITLILGTILRRYNREGPQLT